jgi:CHASE2 domain-containing sensor protein
VRLLRVGVAWSIVLIGVLHVLVTFGGYDSPSLDALWFAGSGLAVILIGVLHVLSATAARHVRAVGAVAAGSSVAGIVLATTFSVLTGWTEPQGPVLVLLFAVSGALTLAARRETPLEGSSSRRG